MSLGSAVDYTDLIPAENANQPNFVATVGTVANSIGAITAAINSIPAAFDLDNAAGVQLNVIGQWVGQPRVVPSVLTIPYFGFSELSTGEPDGDQQPFGELGNQAIGGAWYDLGDPVGTTSVLSDAQYRIILRAAIIRNQYDGTLGELETALQDIFGCVCTVNDNGTMNLTINVSEPVNQTIQALVANFDIIPRPGGVKIGTINYADSLSASASATSSASGTLTA